MSKVFDDVRRLRYFISIAHEGSISAAARKHNVAQPALTHHLHELEGLIGRPLAHRSASGVELTGTGSTFLGLAEAVVAAVDTADADLASMARDFSGMEVRVGVPPSLAPVIAPLLMAAASKLPRGVTLNVLDAMTRQSPDMLDRDQLDLAIAYTTEDEPDVIGAENLFLATAIHEYGLASDHAAKPISFEELSQMALTLPPRGRPIRDIAEQALAARGLSLRVTIELDSLEGRKHLAITGKANTLMPLHSIQSDVERKILKALAIEPPGIRRLITLHTNRTRGHAVHEAIRQRLRQIIDEQTTLFVPVQSASLQGEKGRNLAPGS